MCLAAALRAAVSATVAGRVLSTSHADLVARGAHRGNWLLQILVRYAIKGIGSVNGHTGCWTSTLSVLMVIGTGAWICCSIMEGILALCLSARDPILKFAVQITLRLSYGRLERLPWSDVSFLTDGNRGVGIRNPRFIGGSPPLLCTYSSLLICGILVPARLFPNGHSLSTPNSRDVLWLCPWQQVGQSRRDVAARDHSRQLKLLPF
jgi:hypothetical protein